MNFYIISHKQSLKYLAASMWGEPGDFNWTIDIFFSVISTDKQSITDSYHLATIQYPAYMVSFEVREVNQQERLEILRYLSHAAGVKFTGTPNTTLKLNN